MLVIDAPQAKLGDAESTSMTRKQSVADLHVPASTYE